MGGSSGFIGSQTNYRIHHNDSCAIRNSSDGKLQLYRYELGLWATRKMWNGDLTSTESIFSPTS
jgi:hypothetical protein